MLVAKSYTSASAHITGSTGNLVNFIFKDNNNTGDTILSGSNNIIGNPVAPTAGFRRYVSNGNIALFGLLPQLSSSMSTAFPLTMNGNFIQANTNGIIIRGPVTSSVTWNIAANFIQGGFNIGTAAATNAEKIFNGLVATNNAIPGTLNVIANSNNLASVATFTFNNINGGATITLASSSINFTNTIIGDSNFNLNNTYYNTIGPGNGLVTAQRNTILGNNNTINVTGSLNPGTGAQPQLNDFTLTGANNTIFSDASGSRPGYHSFYKSIIAGYQLIVSASSAAADLTNHGSAFFGRFAENDGRRNKSSDTVFSVGTGTTTTLRKTGFLIDSGSNTFVEGTFNVSGSTSISGSTSMTGSLTLFSSSVAPSDLIMYGHKMFNVGAFQSNTTQSGSSGVSQSMNFDQTDISQGVSIVSNSRITLANAGTYNIQFSAQIDRVSGSGTDTINIWLKKNGVNVSASAGAVTITGGALAAKAIAAWNYVVNAAANDYYELAWQTTDTNIQLINVGETGNVPSIPSIILTVTQVR